MTDNRRQILDMLAGGKITAEEAERLIAALERGGAGPTALSESDKIKYLRVLVDTKDPIDGLTKVNVRVPMQLLRAGVRLNRPAMLSLRRGKRSLYSVPCVRKASPSTSTMSRRIIWKS